MEIDVKIGHLIKWTKYVILNTQLEHLLSVNIVYLEIHPKFNLNHHINNHNSTTTISTTQSNNHHINNHNAQQPPYQPPYQQPPSQQPFQPTSSTISQPTSSSSIQSLEVNYETEPCTCDSKSSINVQSVQSPKSVQPVPVQPVPVQPIQNTKRHKELVVQVKVRKIHHFKVKGIEQ